MMITRATEYACLTLLYLAKQPPGRVSFTAEIAEAERIPSSFLVKVVPKLVKAGLIHSRRGSSGGLELARAPETISLAAVLQAIEGEMAANVCTANEPYVCFRAGCALQRAFLGAQTKFVDHLEGISLADLARRDTYAGDRPALALTTPEGGAP